MIIDATLDVLFSTKISFLKCHALFFYSHKTQNKLTYCYFSQNFPKRQVLSSFAANFTCLLLFLLCIWNKKKIFIREIWNWWINGNLYIYGWEIKLLYVYKILKIFLLYKINNHVELVVMWYIIDVSYYRFPYGLNVIIRVSCYSK